MTRAQAGDATALYHQKMRDRSHRRHLSAPRALATVQKMGVVAIQVNVGAARINVGEGAGVDLEAS